MRSFNDPLRTRLDDLMGAYDINTTAQRGAGWQNPVTGYGTDRDKTTYTAWRGYQPIDLSSLASLYHGSDLAARVIDVVPDEEFRLPYKVTVKDDETDKQIEEEFVRLEVTQKVVEGRVWGRLFGGSALIFGAEDGRSAASPLRIESVKKLDFLTVVDRRYLWPITWQDQGAHAGTPEIYALSATWPGIVANNYMIHHSRMIRFPGVRTGRREKLLNASWDYSVLDRVLPQVRLLDTIYKGVEILVTDGPQGVYKVKGLMQQIMAGNERALMRRFELADMYRSTLRAILIDAEDESFERQQITYSGLPEILVQMQRRLSSSVQIPILVLFGQSPVGLGDHAEDMRWFYDLTQSSQTRTIAPILKQIATIVLHTLGKADKVKDLCVEFEPLWQPSAEEIAEERNLIAQADGVYVQNGIFTPEEVALSRVNGTGRWSREWTAVDRKTREKMLSDIMRNLGEGSEPGMPGAEIGRTPGLDDVRGMGRDNAAADIASQTSASQETSEEREAEATE